MIGTAIATATMNGQSIPFASFQVLPLDTDVLPDFGHRSCALSRSPGGGVGDLSASSPSQGDEYAAQVQIPYEGYRKEYDGDDYHQRYDELPLHFSFLLAKAVALSSLSLI
jgi:hypothetical protein